MSNPTMAQYEREMEGAWDLNRQLKRRVAELEKHIASLPQLENQWVSVEDYLPKTTMSVLVTDGRKVGELTYTRYVNGTGKWAGANKHITAWMLKPKSPEALKEQDK